MGKYLIGTDIGTSGTKSVMVDLNGKVMASSLVEYQVLTPQALWAEQWPDVWVDATVKTIKAVLAEAKVNPAEVGGDCHQWLVRRNRGTL
ncbi:FGGY family carbohydrate kinase [Capillibacterium thermochitinicola]|uniref:FGGY family carbohydrate kinase n=1 Tax=Capillibacterium thermochitinicola TaxID=2699427 RepID=UPI002F2B7126